MSNPFDTGLGTKTSAKSRPANGDGFDTVTPEGDVKSAKTAGDPFSSPSSVSDHRIPDFVGEILLVEPTEVIEDMLTEIGPTDAVRADIIPLTGELDGVKCQDMLVFPMALKRALRKVMDGDNPYLIARLTMGNKKPGKNAPYIFVALSDEELPAYKAKARGYLGLA